MACLSISFSWRKNQDSMPKNTLKARSWSTSNEFDFLVLPLQSHELKKSVIFYHWSIWFGASIKITFVFKSNKIFLRQGNRMKISNVPEIRSKIVFLNLMASNASISLIYKDVIFKNLRLVQNECLQTRKTVKICKVQFFKSLVALSLLASLLYFILFVFETKSKWW